MPLRCLVILSNTTLQLPISGSIIGLFLLLTALWLKIIPVAAVKKGSEFLLLFLTLLFVPASVGIIKQPSLFTLEGAVVTIAVILSTIITMIIVGITSQAVEGKEHKRKEKHKWLKH